jgi:endonuclease/exonuclease/phosphatase family metal-dependent hydrolase
MPSVLTWNIYHGTINNVTPMDRLAHIATLCQNNNVDIICLQEVPQNALDNQLANGFGIPNNGTNVMITLGNIVNFLNNYTVLQGYAEDNPNRPQATNTTDGYLIICRNATFRSWDNLEYYQPENFLNQYSVYLRPPIKVDLVDNNNNTIVAMNWHAEANAPAAGWSLEILDALLPSAQQIPNNTVYVVAGDFNVRGNFSGVFGRQQNFIGWTNIVATYPGVNNNRTIQGLDHILTSVDSNPASGNQLNFTSDAYHYPIAAQF